MTGNGNHGASAGGIGLVTVLIALIFLFVWPGPFRWDYRGGSPMTKVDRISGTTFLLESEGWRKVATNVREELPVGQSSDVTASGRDVALIPSREDQQFALYVHNNSGYAVTEVDVEARLGKVVRRIIMVPEDTILPGTSAGVDAVGVPDDVVPPSRDKAESFHWKIVGAKGYPVD
jgi:hypothetical protein